MRFSLYIVLIILSLSGLGGFAQNKDRNLYNGTQSFAEKKYTEAEVDFRISQSKNKDQKSVAEYNLGTSIYRQNNSGEAKYKFFNAVEAAQTKEQKHKAFHNLGNSFMKEENYQGAAEAYKNALRNNPYDEETRYNYALAKKKAEENPPKSDQNKDKKGGDNNQNQQDQNKDKQDKGNNQDKKDSDKGNKDDQKKDGNDKKDKGEGNDKEEEQQPKRPNGANKQQIENLLEAVNNAEKKIQDKVNAKKVKGQPKQNEKDW